PSPPLAMYLRPILVHALTPAPLLLVALVAIPLRIHIHGVSLHSAACYVFHPCQAEQATTHEAPPSHSSDHPRALLVCLRVAEARVVAQRVVVRLVLDERVRGQPEQPLHRVATRQHEHARAAQAAGAPYRICRLVAWLSAVRFHSERMSSAVRIDSTRPHS